MRTRVRPNCPAAARLPRRAIVTVLTAAMASVGLTVIGAVPASAHGAATTPGSRTYLCYQDGHWTGGDLDPRNAACKQAVAQGGKQPLWDWFGVLRSDGGGRMAGYIPDGQLCSGGNPKYAAYDLARSDWPATRLTSGGRYTMRYNAWAPHPGVFRLFVTQDGYDPAKPLKWSDLESRAFSTWSETTPNGNGEYFWDVTWPANKTGRHIIYSVWSRTDSKETFYNCSDVVFDGGNGEIIGIPGRGHGPTPSTPTPSRPTPSRPTPSRPTPSRPTPSRPTPSTPTPSTPTPSTSASSSALTSSSAPASSSASSSAGGVPTPPASHDHSGGTDLCQALATQRSWPGGFLGYVTVFNRGASRSRWTVTFGVGPGTRIYSGWNATVRQVGTTVTAQAPAWNRTLATGEQITIGFVAAGASAPSGNIQLNGVSCLTDGGTAPSPNSRSTTGSRSST